MTRLGRIIAALVLLLAGAAAALAQGATVQTSAGALRIEQIAGGFDQPWSLAFLPDGSQLVTERGGRLWRVADGRRHPVRGVGPVRVRGQGGLLDVLVPRDFAQTREVYFAHARPQGAAEGTALARARLSADATRLLDWQVIFETTPGSSGGAHFGGRLVEGRDGYLYLTIGDRGDRPAAQDLSRHNGSVIRMARDGSVPPDNPFAGTPGAQPEIWSYGHRNPQGAALDLQGRLWTVEHGAKGGDEVNHIRPGVNYGWPVISYGTHYSGARIGEGTHKDGMAQPEFYWDPSIAPSGMTFHSGALWPQWRGDLFVGSLKFHYIARLSGTPLREVERIEAPQTRRVRDVREGPGGALWFLSVGRGALYRMTPG